MKKTITFILAIFMLASVFAGCQKDKTPEGFCIGYSKVNITPNLEWNMGLYGYNDQSTRRATGVLEPLYATCIAAKDEAGTITILFGEDLLHANGWISDMIRNKITDQTGIPGENINFAGTHTHSAPSHDEKLIVVDNYNREFVEKCTNAALEAIADLAPAEMYTHFVRLEDMNYRRHYLLDDGTYWGRPLANLPNGASGYHCLSKADDMLQMVKFTREGKKDVLIVNWQGHARGNTEGHYTEYSSDYIGAMRRVLLEQGGVESLFLLGASGDVNCASELSPSSRARTYLDYGTTIANKIMVEYENFQKVETGSIQVQTKKFRIPSNTEDYSLNVFSIGEVGFIMVPYEMFTSIALAIKEQSPYPMTFIGTVANGSNTKFYMPDEKAFTYDCYERSSKYISGDAEIFRDQYLYLLGQCYEQTGLPSKEKAEGYVMDTTPQLDPEPYVNPAVGNTEMIIPGRNNLYKLYLSYSGATKVVLVEGEELAKEIINKSSMKLYIDDRGVAVDMER